MLGRRGEPVISAAVHIDRLIPGECPAAPKLGVAVFIDDNAGSTISSAVVDNGCTAEVGTGLCRHPDTAASVIAHTKQASPWTVRQVRVSDKGNARSLIVLDRELFHRQGAAGIDVDAISRPPTASRCALQSHLRDPDAGSCQIESGIRIVLDNISRESCVGAVEVHAVPGSVLDSVPAEPADAELAAHHAVNAAVQGDVGDLDVRGDDPEDGAAIETFDGCLLVPEVYAHDRQVCEVIDSNGVMANANHFDGVAGLGIERFEDVAERGLTAFDSHGPRGGWREGGEQ